MIARQMSNQILEAAAQYPAVAVTGPRQSGKTTLCRELFPDYAYANLEKPETRQFAIEDPNGFLAQFDKPVILDEVQRVPDLFSYIMTLVDEHKRMGEFILSGSQNFHLQQAISQSLAGRCSTLKILPMSSAAATRRSTTAASSRPIGMRSTRRVTWSAMCASWSMSATLRPLSGFCG